MTLAKARAASSNSAYIGAYKGAPHSEPEQRVVPAPPFNALDDWPGLAQIVGPPIRGSLSRSASVPCKNAYEPRTPREGGATKYPSPRTSTGRPGHGRISRRSPVFRYQS